MMAGLIGSMKAIFWGLVLLIFCLLVWSVIAVQFVHAVNKRVTENNVYDRQQCERCPRAFSSVSESLLTLFQQIVAGDSWGQITLPVIEEGPLTIVFFMGVFVTTGMAVMNLILGVVVNIAMQAHDSLKTEIDDEKLVERMEAHSHLLSLCSELDCDGNGSLSKDELFAGYEKSEKFRETLKEMDIEEEDMEILWTILDEEKTGKVCYNSFVSRCYGMKLSNTQFMLAYIKFYITQIRHYISCQMSDVRSVLVELEEEVEEEKEIMEKEMGEQMKIEGLIEEELAGASKLAGASGDGRAVASQKGSKGKSKRSPNQSSPSNQSSASAVLARQLSPLSNSEFTQDDFVDSINQLKERLDFCLQSALKATFRDDRCSDSVPSQVASSNDGELAIMHFSQEPPSATIVKLPQRAGKSYSRATNGDAAMRDGLLDNGARPFKDRVAIDL